MIQTRICGGVALSNEKIRSFIAVDINDNTVLQRIVDCQMELTRTGADLKLVEPENIHATIRFLGEVEVSLLDQVRSELSQLIFQPFTIELRGIGAFPNPHRPNVVWVGITRGEGELQRIFSSLEPHLRGLGFPADKKGFSPHITIGRVKSCRNRDVLYSSIMELSDREFGSMTVDSIRLKKSVLTPKGPVYSTIYEQKAGR
jgi:2'-5' RNA ligase